MEEALAALEEALAGLDDGERAIAAGPAVAGLAAAGAALDEDDLAAAARRGILMAAAAGPPAEGIGPGSPAVLETAADLADAGVGEPLTAAIAQVAPRLRGYPRTQAVARTLAGDRQAALEALALLLLAQAMAGDDD